MFQTFCKGFSFVKLIAMLETKLCKIENPKVSSVAGNSAKLKTPLLKVSSIAANAAKLKPLY